MSWLTGLSGWQLIGVIIVALVVLLIASAWLTRALVRRGMKTPFVLHLINRVRERIVRTVKRPITVMVLEEVADVIQTGNYTKNISAAIVENHDELKVMVAEKIRADPNMKVIGRLPGYNTAVSELSETTLRVIIDMLGDPRTDELVSDLLRNNLQQIRQAVRDRENETVDDHASPDVDAIVRRQHRIAENR